MGVWFRLSAGTSPEHVDGALVEAACLNPESFARIANAQKKNGQLLSPKYSHQTIPKE
jgi:hypothetical protein